jgi:hypothetical protein
MPSPGPAVRLALAKTRLRARIAARRQHCASLAVRVAAPLRWVEQVQQGWRSLGKAGKLGGFAVAWLAWRWARRSEAGVATAATRGPWRDLGHWLLTTMGRILVS